MLHMFIVVALLAGSGAVAQGCDYRDVVLEHFPSTIRQGTAPSQHAVDWACADFDGSGVRGTLVAAYSNGEAAVVRVLATSGTDWQVIAEADAVAGREPEVTALDLDGDHRDEIIVAAMHTSQVKEYTIFRFEKGHLTDITPVPPARTVDPDLGISEFLDMDGDGRLEMVSTYRCEGCPSDVFALRQNGTFAFIGSPVYIRRYARVAGEPKTINDSFDVANPQGSYEMLIGVQGDVPVASAIVQLNGVRVVSPADLHKGVTLLRVNNIPILPQNAISVELRGDPKSAIVLTIRQSGSDADQR